MEKRRRFLPPAQQHHGEQPGRERPPLWTHDPDPRAGYGVAHVPAACLRSCDGLRTPMSRTIDSGSNRKCTKQCGARFVTIRYRLSAAMTRVMSRSIWHHISPPGCCENTRPSRCGFSCGARRRQRSPLRSTVRPARPAGVDSACAPPESANTRWSRFRSPLTAPGTRRMFKTSRSCRTARPSHRPMWSASE